MKLYNIYKYKFTREIIGFLISGVVANLVSFTTYILLVNYLTNSILISSITGQILGVISNYFFNSRLVFKKKLNLSRKFIYLTYYLSAIYLVGRMIEIITIYGLDYRISWFICILGATIFNFLFLRLFAFKK